MGLSGPLIPRQCHFPGRFVDLALASFHTNHARNSRHQPLDLLYKCDLELRAIIHLQVGIV